MITTVTVSKEALGLALCQLNDLDDRVSNRVFMKLVSAWHGQWGARLDRAYATVKLDPAEYDVYRSLRLPRNPVDKVRFAALYKDLRHDDDGELLYPNTEVLTHTVTRPPKHKTFRTAGGRVRLTCISVTRLTATKENNPTMARRTTTAKTASKKAAPVVDDEDEDELDDLEALEDEDDEDVEVEDDEDEPEDEEDEDEEEEPAPAKRRGTTASKVAASKKAAAPVSKTSSAAAKKAAPKKTGNRQPPNRELPAGKLGPVQIAGLVGTTDRAVRIFLRENNIEKPDGLGRYAFSKAAADAIVKKMKAAKRTAAK